MLQSLVLQTKGFTDTQNDNARAFSCIGDLFNLLLQVCEILFMGFFFISCIFLCTNLIHLSRCHKSA